MFTWDGGPEVWAVDWTGQKTVLIQQFGTQSCALPFPKWMNDGHQHFSHMTRLKWIKALTAPCELSCRGDNKHNVSWRHCCVSSMSACFAQLANPRNVPISAVHQSDAVLRVSLNKTTRNSPHTWEMCDFARDSTYFKVVKSSDPGSSESRLASCTKSPSAIFLWSCTLNTVPCSVPLSSSCANDGQRRQFYDFG